MAGDLVDRIIDGDRTALTRVSSVYASADASGRTHLVDKLAKAASASEPCLEALLQVIDDHDLDRPSIRRVLVDNDQADDAHQDVLIVVAQSIGRFRGDSAFTTWLHAVARNVAVDQLRKRKDTVTLDPAREPLVTAAARLSSLIASRSDLVVAVNALPAPYQEAVILRDIEQRSYREIAVAMNTEMNTVKSRISRGRALVAAMMTESLNDPTGPVSDGDSAHG